MSLVKVNDSPFVRDTNSMALFNTDVSAKNDYESKTRMMMNQKRELNTVREEIDGLKSDVLEIKVLLNKLLEK
jgi:archaellum component FlaC